MEDILIIRRLGDNIEPPYELLNLAEPFMKVAMEDYIKRGICYVAYNNNKELVGTYILLQTQPKTLELVNVSIDEQFRRRGNGKRLVEHAIGQSAIHGAEVMEIGVGNSSIRLLEMYQQNGFNISSIDFDYFIRNFNSPIYENGIHCKHLIKLRIDIFEK